MAGEAVGERIEEDRSAAFAEDLLLAADGVDDREGVVAVDALGVHLLGVDARTDAREDVVAHRLAGGLAAHAVLIVEDVEDDRESALVRAFPEHLVLVHRGEAERFPHRSAAHRSVADVGDDDAGLRVDFLEESGAGRDVRGSADDCVVRVDAERGEEGVHRAAESLVEAGLPGEDLGEGSVHEEVGREFLDAVRLLLALDDAEDRAAEERFHRGHQFLVGQFFDRGKSLGEDFAVAAVRTENVVVLVEEVGLTDGGGFLAERQMRRSRMVVFYSGVGVRRLDRIEHGLELADDGHVPVNAEEILRLEIRFFVGDRLVVLIDRNVGERNLAALAHDVRIDEL